MKATALYREASQVLTPWMRQHGFTRLKGRVLRYYRAAGDDFLVVSLAIGKYGHDRLLGFGEFNVFFDLSPKLAPNLFQLHGHHPYALMTALFSAHRLEELRTIQNDVIAKLIPPPADNEHVIALENSGGGSRDMLIELFYQPITEPYRAGAGAEFRYGDSDDVRRWVEFILDVLPEALDTFLSNCGIALTASSCYAPRDFSGSDGEPPSPASLSNDTALPSVRNSSNITK